MKDKILNQFKEHQKLYESFGEKCKNTIQDLLKEKSLQIHSINHRIKAFESLENKIGSSMRFLS